MWRARVMEAGVAIGAVVSLVVLAALLTAPLLPQPATGVAAPPARSADPSAPADSGPLTPIGIYQLRGAYSFGPCLALELGPEAYPTADGAEGTATVHYWLRGMTGCDARTGELLSTDARVTRAVNDAAELVGYGLRFTLPLLGSGPPGDDVPSVTADIVILARQSSEQVLQAIESEGGGQGMVLDRVPELDPRLDPLPSVTPLPAGVGPTGLYLLQGPLDADGPCLAIELARESYPADVGTSGSAVIRWWQPGGGDPADPTMCLSRTGEMQELAASVALVTDSGGAPVGYAVSYALPLEGSAVHDVELAINSAASNRDQLRATLVTSDPPRELVFDRVDELNPPPAP